MSTEKKTVPEETMDKLYAVAAASGMKPQDGTCPVDVSIGSLIGGVSLIFAGVLKLLSALDGDPNLVPINGGSGTGAEEALQPEPAATGAEIPTGAEYDTKEGPAVDEGKPTTVGDKPVEEDAPQQTSQSTVTADDLTKVIVRKIKQNRSNTQKIGAILKTFGVAKVSELPAGKYEAFLTELAQL